MNDDIKISAKYPSYWEYKGKPVLLLGGNVEDNLFQISNLQEHLSELSSLGGNYVRCTMSSRDPGDVWPFAQQGHYYDLHEFSQEYWNRFSKFLDLTFKLDIIVQIEIWDRFDFARKPWLKNPFNPNLNINYSVSESNLQVNIETHPNFNESRFFFTVPELDNNQVVLHYQKAYVDKFLSFTLEYPHILYCIDNETAAEEAWGRYWAIYIKEQAAKQNKNIHVTEMWDPHDLNHPMHKRTFDNLAVYSFCDVSQNNHQVGQTHWDNAQKVRQYTAKTQVRPLNNVKIYGSDQYRFGNNQDGIQRFWRNVFGKMASARFHRPPAGLGLSELAQVNIKSMRMLLDKIDIFSSEPHNELILGRQENGGYCLGTPAEKLAVFFPLTSEIRLDTTSLGDWITIDWLDILTSSWIKSKTVFNTGEIKLENYNKAYQVAVLN